MSISETMNALRLAAMNRHRERLFGATAVLRVFGMAPATGETQLGAFTSGGWFGQRAENTTTAVGVEQSEWQFQVAATVNWAVSQAFMKKVRSLTVDGRRWAVTKVEKPVGASLVWKLKAKEQG